MRYWSQYWQMKIWQQTLARQNTDTYFEWSIHIQKINTFWIQNLSYLPILPITFLKAVFIKTAPCSPFQGTNWHCSGPGTFAIFCILSELHEITRCHTALKDCNAVDKQDNLIQRGVFLFSTDIKEKIRETSHLHTVVLIVYSYVGAWEHTVTSVYIDPVMTILHLVGGSSFLYVMLRAAWRCVIKVNRTYDNKEK